MLKLLGVGVLSIAAVAAYAALARDQIEHKHEAVAGNVIVLKGAETRLWGTQAPPLSAHCTGEGIPWACGQAARAALQGVLERSRIDCQIVAESPVRQVARCETGRHGDLSRWLVAQGWAAEYLPETRGGYGDIAQSAQLRKIGVWADR